MRRVLWIVLAAVAALVITAFIYVKFNDPKLMVEQNPASEKGKTVNFIKPTFKQFKLILDSTDDEIPARFGEPDQVIETGPDSIYYGYVYRRLGITAIFGEEKNKPLYILCSKNISIKKAKSGMNFAQIQKRLGKANIKKESADTWVMSYKFKGLLISFKANTEDGRNSQLQISETANYTF